MSNYTKTTNFATKDTLPSGNAAKIVKGTEINTEFDNIATAVATKADTSALTSKLDTSAYTAADVLTKVKTVDGAGSGLDADLLDGVQASGFVLASAYTAADVLTKIKTVDGAGSGLDADTLDGLQASAFTKDSDYTTSLSANGHVTLPNGLMVQWGRAYISGNTANASVSLPTNFTTACFAVVVSKELSSTGEGDNSGIGTTAPTTSTIRITNGSSAGNFRWIAIGH